MNFRIIKILIMLLMKTHVQNLKYNFNEVNFECLIQYLILNVLMNSKSHKY